MDRKPLCLVERKTGMKILKKLTIGLMLAVSLACASYGAEDRLIDRLNVMRASQPIRSQEFLRRVTDDSFPHTPMSQYNTGWIYMIGKEVERDFKESAKWFRKSAIGGNADSQVMLGIFYLNGIGVNTNDREAFRWYRAAADQGEAGGRFGLGSMYLFGQGCLPDFIKGVELIKSAAEMGYSDAQSLLGTIYADGVYGAPKDKDEAIYWYSLAADQEDPIAQAYLDTLK